MIIMMIFTDLMNVMHSVVDRASERAHGERLGRTFEGLRCARACVELRPSGGGRSVDVGRPISSGPSLVSLRPSLVCRWDFRVGGSLLSRSLG